jgi:glutamine cyclotransferase
MPATRLVPRRGLPALVRALAVLGALALPARAGQPEEDGAGLRLLKKYPHVGTNRDTYSEGLDFHGGFLWHTTKTGLTKLDPENDLAVVDTWKFKHQSHTESAVWYKGELYNFTYRTTQDKNSALFKLKLGADDCRAEVVGHGLGVTNWGTCRDGDPRRPGSETAIIYTAEGKALEDQLLWYDVATGKTTRKLKVEGLSGMEDLGMDRYGTVWASSYGTYHRGCLYRIDPETGKVIEAFPGPADLASGIIDGIAIRSLADHDVMYVTGKRARFIYEYRVPEPGLAGPPPKPAEVRGHQVVKSHPHDPDAWCQGLAFRDGFLYEGTGLRGRSALRRVELETGKVLAEHKLDRRYFGEGIALFGDKVVQLTWKARKGFVYERATLKPLGEFAYPTEGWGITHDGERLIMSDGSATLRFLDPKTFEETGRILVRDGPRLVFGLNELESVEGRVYANVYKTERLAVIDPGTGRVTEWVDLEGLLKPEDRRGHKPNVLNGIAYDAAGRRLFVTGKRWPKLFEIRVVPRD